ncbi:restriction endonuclease [Ascidiaceihabitans sp.]|nr:restriction endonuclease [Ascidiaceihabitans sp.]
MRFIKLGASGAWAKEAIEEGVVYFGAHGISHSDCVAENWQNVRKQLEKVTSGVQNQSEGLRQIKDFYCAGETLWVTLVDGHIWWTITESQPETIAQTDVYGPSHQLRCMRPWSDKDIEGNVLVARNVSSRLTKTFSYQRTICTVEAEAYLLRLINQERDPLQVEAEQILAQQIDLVQRLIERLHWAEFENLVDLIFARNGWRRTTVLGRTIPDIDLVATEPVSGRTAWVQIKAKASQKTIDDYYQRFLKDGTCTDFFFVCHSAKSKVALPESRSTHVWTGRLVAEQAIEAGLSRWLIDHL